MGLVAAVACCAVAIVLIIALLNIGCADQTAGGIPGRSTGEITNARVIRILVKPKPGADLKALEAFHAAKQATVKKQYPAIGNLQVVEFKSGVDLHQIIADYKATGLVEYAEPDQHVRHFEQ